MLHINPFSIVRMLHLRSNITSKISCSALGAEILRIARTTSTCNEFRTSSKILINRAQNQGGNVVVLKRTLSQYFGRHFVGFQKFNDTSIIFITETATGGIL